MIKAVIFDFGRVISAQKPLSLFRGYEAHLGLVPGAINQIMFKSQAWRDALIGRLTVEGFWSAIGPELGLDSHEKITDFRLRYHNDETINEGVLNIIRQLCGRYKLAVLSNSPPGLTEWLSDWEIIELLDVVFCSGDEGIMKPEPAAYHTTLKRLGVLPHEAVFVDDTIGHVVAAQKLGIRSILFTTAEKLAVELNYLLDLQKNSPAIDSAIVRR